ncbi:MAG TPA: hypothetical protein VII56_07350 [Rhizomicrobium sp.]
MRKRLHAVACAGVFMCVSPANADDGSDLDRIPPAANEQVAATDAAAGASRALYLQDDFALYAHRAALAVPLPPSTAPSWEERLFLDARVDWKLSDTLSLVYSGRFNFRAEDDLPFPSHENIRHDFREGYVAWEIGDGAFAELGRINLKSGVALGFNPTDFFKTRAVVEPLTADPSVLREDRLGTVMLLGQRVWNGAALTVALAPKLASGSAIYFNDNLPGFDPVFDRTNAQARILVKASVTLFDDVSPEFLFYNEAGRNSFGLNLTRVFGQSIVGYVEWAGGTRASLVHDALVFGRATGTLPPAAPSIIPQSAARSFQNDLSIGASYATAAEMSFNLEYHYHQAGFSDADWQNWFAAGAVGAPARGALWYIRSFAADRQEPLSRSSLFFRASWQDAFVHDLALSAFVDADTRGGSGIAQLSADYYASRDWTIGGLVDATFGGRRSDFGSLPESTNVLVKVSHYL